MFSLPMFSYSLFFACHQYMWSVSLYKIADFWIWTKTTLAIFNLHCPDLCSQYFEEISRTGPLRSSNNCNNLQLAFRNRNVCRIFCVVESFVLRHLSVPLGLLWQVGRTGINYSLHIIIWTVGRQTGPVWSLPNSAGHMYLLCTLFPACWLHDSTCV